MEMVHQQHQQRSSVVHCSLLLELADAEREKAFWEDDRTVRAFTGPDLFTTGHTLLTNSTAVVLVGRALTDNVRSTWHICLCIFLNIISCCITLFMLLRRADVYSRYRHKIIAVNRLMRFGSIILMGCLSTTRLHQTLGGVLGAGQLLGRSGGRSTAHVALINLIRPLFFLPMMHVSHGNWYFGAKYYVPLQLLSLVVACFGSSRHQPCRLACDPYASLILQTACTGTTQVHQLMLGSMLAPLFRQLLPLGSADNPEACSDVVGAARVLSWYSHAAYMLLISGSVLLSIEWTLKARWMHQSLNRQLVYGPSGWPCSQQGSSRFGGSWLQLALALVVVPVVGLALLWFVCLWLVPLLPHEPCTACDAGDTCPTVPYCEGLLCQDTGIWAALVMHGEMVVTFINFYLIMRFLTGLLPVVCSVVLCMPWLCRGALYAALRYVAQPRA